MSNVQLVDPDTKQPARVGFTVSTDKNGKTTRTRFFKPSRRAATPKKAAKASTSKAKADTAVDADKDAE